MTLENAVSVASVLLLAEATLTEIPEKKEEPAQAFCRWGILRPELQNGFPILRFEQ